MKGISLNKINQLKSVMKKNDYVINKLPYKLNIVAKRSRSTTPNSFDDVLYVFYKNDKNRWVGFEMPCTTDAGIYYLLNPMSVDGTALLLQGQYDYKLGYHKGQYKAFVQDGDVDILRNPNRKNELDFISGQKYTGRFGINLHRGNLYGTTEKVGRYSGGCIVVANINDYNKLIDLAQKQERLYGNKFKITLIDEKARVRAIFKRSLIGLTALGLTMGGLYFAVRKGWIKF